MRSIVVRIATAAALAFLAVSAFRGLVLVRVAAQPLGPDLSTLFDRGPIFQDRNSDSVVDFVDARIVLADRASPGDVAAAATVAARLGFETMAMNLPIVGAPEQGHPTIVVGSAALQRAGVSAPAVPALQRGEGLVLAAAANGAPAAVVIGGDDAGTQAAAALFAGRLPRVWDPSGPTLARVSADISRFLTDHGVRAGSVRIPSVRVRAGVDALEQLNIAAALSTTADATKARDALRADGAQALSYPGAQRLHIELTASAGQPLSVDLQQPAPAPGPRGVRPGSDAKESLDLANLYTIDGLLGDGDKNLIPDRIDAVLSPSGAGIDRTVDLAARLGLESTGIPAPIALLPDSIGKADSAPTLVLIGRSHPLVERLISEKKLAIPQLGPGEGAIQVVRKAFGENTAVIVTGSDESGVARALEQMAERFPHVWARGKDRTTLDDIREDVRRFVSGRTPASQAATALYKLDQIAAGLEGKDLESAHITISIEKPAGGFAEFARNAAAARLKAAALEVTVDDRDVQKAKEVFSDEFDVPSEVDDFWQIFRSRVVSGVKRNQPVIVEARLSEPPELRARIEQEAKAALVKAGAPEAGTSVTVLSAYKQGYSWLYDVVRPALAGKPVGHITIRFARIGPPPEWTQQAMFAPTRWLLEAYPIDEVLARDLKIGLDQIRFEQAPIGAPAYEVTAAAPDGSVVFHGTFEPRFVVRPFFDQFPDYEKVRVTTGWITASSGGRALADQRIATDPERFWDRFQSRTLPAIYDYVMRNSKGKPRAQDAPHFGELSVDLTLSEPDYQIGIDKEQIAPLESVQEEIYFHTLHFFDVLGRYARGPALDYPGRVLPIVRPKADGKPGHAKIVFTGFAANRPSVTVAYRERGGPPLEERLDIPKVAVEPPSVLTAIVRAGQPGLQRLELRAKVDSDHDERAALIKRTRYEEVDEKIMSAEQVAGIVANLERLRAAGLYRDALAYHDVGAIAIAANWEYDPASMNTQRVALLQPDGEPPPFPDIKALLPAGYRYNGEPLVQWDTPIPPPEGNAILARMSAFKEATVYKIGQSYLGKDIWAMDLMAPIEATHWSQAKASTLKPTIVYSARQDANEVSSTSHTLKLAEMLLTDPEYRKHLNKVNVVVHPFTNPDGAQLAYDLYKVTPDYLLHPGYLGPLGVSLVTRWDSDPMYPESKVRPKIWRTWLPDIFLNPHGYPSHEWVQMFSEYAAWVRNRVTEARDWAQTRGWFMPFYEYTDDPKYPRHKEAAFRIRDMITQNINAVPEVRELNARAYDRYRRYGFAWDPENFKMDFVNGVLIYTNIKGGRGDPGTKAVEGDDFMVRQPAVTIFYSGTEAPDETAHGEWMKLVATMGLQFDKAVLQYLVEGHHVVERKATPFFGGVALTLDRARPPKPPTSSTSEDGSHGRR